jgi:acetylornithine deacetylase/succinyl-diaminopimelate desuccinylase-like protein
MEEVGGVGARLLVDEVAATVVVIGEATDCQLARGHRGRTELDVVFRGQSAHASAPERAANPHFAAARFLSLLGQLDMRHSDVFGASTVAPTLYRTDQASPNVVPGEVVVTLDWRMVPDEASHEVLDRIDQLAQSAAADGVTAEALIVFRTQRTYLGMERSFPTINPGFETLPDDAYLQAARQALEAAYGGVVEIGTWRFATDGGHFASAGRRVIGFGPGHEALAHTFEERIAVSDLRRGLLGNAALAASLGSTPG